MRVIAGKARRIPLIAPVGEDTRPTSDRIKETLFNILQNDLYDCRFLDLFAGSGGIGIEALSRGASFACFCELYLTFTGISVIMYMRAEWTVARETVRKVRAPQSRITANGRRG